MVLKTAKFGQIDISGDKVIEFIECIPGFDNSKRYILIKIAETLPFYWLQSVDEEDLALPVINPFEVMSDYSPMIDNTVLDRLQLASDDELLVVNVAVLPADLMKATVNLAAPILINVVKNLGVQTILNSGEYQIRHPVFRVDHNHVSEKEEGANKYAGSDT